MLPASGCLRLTSENARADQSDVRFDRNQLHGCGKEHRRMFAPLNPGIDHISPFLQHVTTLLLVLRLVIDPSRRPALLVRETLLNPIPIETELVQQGGAGAPQIVNGPSGKFCFAARSTTATVMRLKVARDIGASAS